MGATPVGGGFPSMAKTMRAFDRARITKTANAIRRVLTHIRTVATETIPTDGIGRRVWGRKTSGLRKLLKRERIKISGDTFQGGISVNGLAGLIEKGGRIKEHQIAAAGSVLASRERGFFVKAGVGSSASKRRGVVAAVMHPGGPVAAKPRLRAAIEGAQPRFRSEISSALGEAMVEASNG